MKGLLNKGERAAFVCCSDGRKDAERELIGKTADCLSSLGVEVILSPLMYQKDGCFSGTGRERAEVLMGYYRDRSVSAVMDVSGGDAANMVLPYLDYGAIAESGKSFWGYSDLTCVLNAIYAKTGLPGVLYQIKNLAGECSGLQMKRFADLLEGGNSLFGLQTKMLRGEGMSGTVIGGNTRCFLKLSGTEYMPDPDGKILLLEGYGGGPAQYGAYFSQLYAQGIFDRIGGILLGTFTAMERDGLKPGIVQILEEILDAADSAHVRKLPVAKTQDVGHGKDSCAVIIGGEIRIC